MENLISYLNKNNIQYIITPKQIITYPTTSSQFVHLFLNFDSTQVDQPYQDLTTINIKITK